MGTEIMHSYNNEIPCGSCLNIRCSTDSFSDHICVQYPCLKVKRTDVRKICKYAKENTNA